MKYFFVSLCFLSSFGLLSAEPGEMKRDAAAFLSAYTANRTDLLSKMFYFQSILQEHEKQAVLANYAQELDQLSKQGLHIVSSEVNDVAKKTTASHRVYALCSYTLTMSYAGSNYQVKKYLIGVSEDQEKSWKFAFDKRGLELPSDFPVPSINPENKITGITLAQEAGRAGICILNVYQGSPADQVGLKPGDFLTAVNAEKIASNQTALQVGAQILSHETSSVAITTVDNQTKHVSLSPQRAGDFLSANGTLTELRTPKGQIFVGQAAPGIIATTPNGKAIALSALKGQVVLVNFSATWCESCQEQLPDLVDLYRKFHPQGLEMITVFDDVSESKVNKETQEKHITWPYNFDGRGHSNPNLAIWEVDGIPNNFLIDKAGHVVEIALNFPFEDTVSK